jgi:S-adenosylmethionine hydrolase
MDNPIITLTTDFGYKDPFVGMMKGVILKINPMARVVDITHDITHYNVREAAFIIGMSYGFFPQKTVHIVVVDPGVGSNRRPILVVTDQHYFIGPDNGIFSLIYGSKNETLGVIHITSEHYFMPQRGSTFHGRDIFAPSAAWLTRGVDITKFGDMITDYVTLQFPSVAMPAKTTIEGEVIYIDRFGNAITNIKASDLNALYSLNPGAKLKIVTKGKQTELRNYYSEVTDKGLYSLVNSAGLLELFVYRGNAAVSFDIKLGDIVGVLLSP